MLLSAFDLFTIGIGPSSSHTVGPMRAAARFGEGLKGKAVARVVTTLYGSLALTGRGHGTDKAILLGLEGETPEEIAIESVPARLEAIRETRRLRLAGVMEIALEEKRDLVFAAAEVLPGHPNAMRFEAFDEAGISLAQETYYSIGGGFIVRDGEPAARDGRLPAPHAFTSAADLLDLCARHDCRIGDLMLANETTWRSEAEVWQRLGRIWEAMRESIRRGCDASAAGVLPGGLKVIRRAPVVYAALSARNESYAGDDLAVLDWVTLYALAVNEENAAGGRIVTAPTNGAAGILPAVLMYAIRFCGCLENKSTGRFLLTAAAIGMLYKMNASLSGADVGCQGEVGVACSMAAGALAEYLGGTPQQVENAAEIGMEHNLGLTCDPVGGLVQIPCIERNAMGAVKAISAARMALLGDGCHRVSLDQVIRTMLETGRDMQSKYKETSRGGLAANLVEC